MNIRNIVGAAALAAMAPVAASAAIIQVSDGDYTDAVASNSYSITNLVDGFQFDENFEVGDVSDGDKAIFEFVNMTGSSITIGAGFPASVNPDGGFNPLLEFSFSGGAPVVLDGNTIFSSILANGASTDLTIHFGDVDNTVGGIAQVDVLIEPQVVPVPAGFVLLGTALGGLGFARRFRKS